MITMIIIIVDLEVSFPSRSANLACLVDKYSWYGWNYCYYYYYYYS